MDVGKKSQIRKSLRSGGFGGAAAPARGLGNSFQAAESSSSPPEGLLLPQTVQHNKPVALIHPALLTWPPWEAREYLREQRNTRSQYLSQNRGVMQLGQ